MKLCPLVALALVACLPPRLPDVPPPTDRDGIGTDIGAACEVLRRVGCPEGFPARTGRTCFEAYSRAAELVDVPTVCLQAATTEDDIRACGDSNTLRVRCILPAVGVDGSHAP